MDRLHRSARTLVLLALSLAWLGCQSLGMGSSGETASASAAPASGGLSEILDRGSLRVGISGDLAPLNMKSKEGAIIGLEVDIVTALAHAMGLEVELVETPFPQLLDTLLAGDVDLVISAMTMTPQRNARVAFVGPYFISGTSVLTKSDEIAFAQEPQELNVEGRRFAALEGSTSAQFVEEVLPDTELVATQDYDAAVQMVIDGSVDGLVADFQKCMVSTWRHPEEDLQAIRTPFTVEPLGIALPPDQPLLMNLVTNYLHTLEDTGLLTQLKAKWLSDGAWLSELP